MNSGPMRLKDKDKEYGVVVRREFKSVSDEALRENIKSLKTSQRELNGINDHIRKVLDLPSDRGRSIVGRALHFIVPKRFYPYVPHSFLKIMAEEYDVLELIEGLMRNNINNVQGALKNIAACTLTKEQEIKQLESDIERAQAENWKAERLQEYVTEMAGIEVYEEIKKLLEDEFQTLSDEEKEARKNELLEQLKSAIVIGGKLMETLGKTCSVGLQVFHRAVGQYFQYVNFYGPITVVRDSAMSLTETNQSMYAARDAIVVTFQASLEAIDAAVQASMLINRYSIASPDMVKLLRSGQERLEKNYLKLKGSYLVSNERQLKSSETERDIITVEVGKVPAPQTV